MGILVNTGFDVGSSNPIDSRTVKNTTDERDALVTDGLVYENLKVYCKDTQTEYRWTGTDWEEVGTGGTGGTADLSGYAKTYTSLAELELTSSATINEVISKLNAGEVFTCGVTSFSNYQTMFPYIDSYDSDAFVFIHRGRTPVMSYAKWYRRDGSSEALAYFNGLTGYIEKWTTFTTKKTYTTLTQLKLTADATITQVVNAMLEGERFRSIVTKFNNYQTMFPYEEEADQNAYVLIDKLNGNAVYIAWYRIDGTKHYIGHYANNTLQNWINYSPTTDLSGYAKTYTSLSELGLTAPVSVGEIFNAMPNNTMAVLACEAKDEADGTVNISDIPMSFGVLTIKKNEQGRFSIDYQNSLASSPCNVKRWIGTLKGADGTGLYWKLISTQTTYTSLEELGLTADATIDDVLSKLQSGETFTSGISGFTNYQTLFPYKSSNDQYSRVFIQQGSSLATAYVKWFRKDGSREALANIGSNNKVVGWNEHTMNENIYTSIADLNSVKGTSIELVANTDNTLKIVEALDEGEEFVEWFGNSNDRFGLGANAGGRINYLRIQKTNATNGIILAVTDYGKTFSRVYNGGTLENWCHDKTKATLVTNTTTLKLDVTKRNSSWYGAIKLTYLYDTSPAEIEISFRAATEDLRWAVINGQKYVKQITFTQDSGNTAHYTIGIEFSGTTYGCYQAEVIGGFADINSLTSEAFTGAKTAVYSSPWGKNNGVTLVSAPEDIGLTFPCTSVQLAQAMRNKFNKTINAGAIGIFNCGVKATTITDAPSEYGLLHIETFGYDRILIRFEGISSSNYVGSWIGQIKSSGGAFSDITWEEIHVEKEENSYIPDMYDRNSNGDIPVVGFDRLANSMCLIQNTNLLNNGDTYDEDYVGGWVYTMANDTLIKDKEMFNKIKVLVSIPGVLRVGIVNDKIFEANPRYSTCLVKWLVADFVAFTGLKEYDIDDTILEEGQYIFIECRQGESSWYYNQGSTAVTQGKVTYPASSCTSGLNVADKLDSTTNNVVFKSQSVTSKSAIFTFSGEINVGNKLRTNFLARGYDNTARTDMSDVKSYNQSLFKGGLNVGLYRRTKYSDTRLGKCVENLMNTAFTGNATTRRAYAPAHQERLVGKSVYAFKIDVHTTGNLTIYHVKGKTVDTFEIIDKYTHYVRAKGLQTIHLPFDIKLQSEDEYIAFGGIHCKSTSDNIVFSECKWLYGVVPNWMQMGHINGYIHLNFDPTSYPEAIMEIGDYSNNTNTLNIELICRGEKKSPLEDKYISFTGDSITTFAGFCTKQADVPAGNTAGDNAVYYPASGRTVNNVDATWWGILAKDNRMKILRNDAWSGSRVSSTTGSTDTKCLCGTERYKFLENSSQGTNVTFPYGEPEIVVNMIGTNDLSGNVELGEGILYGLSSPTEDDYKKIYSAYSLMCQRFASYYNRHGGKVVHFIIPRGTGLNAYTNSNGDSIQKVALEFEKIAKSWGHYFIPLSYFTGFNMNQYKNLTCPTSNVLRDFRSSYFNGSDGLHPNVIGMETIADGVHRFLCSIM